MKILRNLVAAVAVLATFSSCYKEEPVTFPESIEGLWASSGCDLSAGKQTMYLLEISDNSSRLVSLILGKGFTSVVEKENMDVDITFNSSKGKGHITGHGRQETSYEFGVSKDGQMMFIRKDGGTISLSGCDGTLDEKVRTLKQTLVPKMQLPNGFVGPSTYNDLGAGITPVLSNTLAAVPVLPTESILDWVLKGLVTGSSSTAAKMIIESMVEDETSRKLDEIIDQVNNINTQLTNLINLVHDTTYERYLNERTNNYLNPLRNLSSEYILRLKEAKEKDEDTAPIVLEWGERTVAGNPAYIEVRNFIGFFIDTIVERKNIYQIYDMYVFNTHPWENLGYGLREYLRACDACVIAQNVLLSHLYYIYSDKYSAETRQKLCDDLRESFETYKAFARDNAVERHKDLAICQIKDAHFIMPTKIVTRDFKNHPWFPNETPWDFENSESAWCFVNGEKDKTCVELYKSCLSTDELKAITDYYKGSPYTSLYEVLKQEANCTLPFSDAEMSEKKVMLQVQTDGGTESQSMTNNNYYLYANNAVEMAKDFKAGRKTIGIAWLERHGFLWMEQWFKQWDTYYSDQLWVRTDITERY